MRILLVEDDDAVAAPLTAGLARYGITAVRVAAGAAAPPHDMVLLDPGPAGGLEACRRLRRGGHIPMILLTTRDDEAARTLGRELGADDCLARPFNVRELVARIRAVDRRARAARDHPVRAHGPLVIDTGRREVRVHGVPVALAPKEYDVLVLLAAEPGAVVGRRHLLETVWEADFRGPGKTLDFHVAGLRRKLGDPTWIENRRGVGFRLAVPA